MVIKTPKTSRELASTLKTLKDKLTNNPIARLLFRKIKKTMDVKNYSLASQIERINSLETTIESLKVKKRKKVETISPNSKFSGIEEVIKAKWAVQNNPNLEINVRN